MPLVLIVHSSSILWNIGLHFSLKYPERYILLYQFIKLDKIAKIIVSIFNGCRTKLGFFYSVECKDMFHASILITLKSTVSDTVEFSWIELYYVRTVEKMDQH